MKKEWVQAYERATAAEKRVAQLEAMTSSSGSAELAELHQKVEQVVKEKDDALASLNVATREAEVAMQEASRLRGTLSAPKT